MEEVSFSGHETFVLRYGWLKKAVDAVTEAPGVFRAIDAVVSLGVGKNMVRSIRHWGLATRVLEEEPGSRGALLRPSEIGRRLFADDGLDPYLEDTSTLWLLHWLLATNESWATTWSWVFSGLAIPDFNTDKLISYVVAQLSLRNIQPPSEKTLRRDIECFIRTYVASEGSRILLEDSLDCPLVELGLVEGLDGGRSYRFARNYHETLSGQVFAFAVLDYWTKRAPERQSLGFAELAFGANSPGTVFKLDEDSLASRLDDLAALTSGRVGFGETAGLKQLYRRGRIDAMDLLFAPAGARPCGRG